jgi:hypothetical protein
VREGPTEQRAYALISARRRNARHHFDRHDRMLAAVLAGEVSNVQLAKAICSPRRMGLPEAPAVH